LMETNVGTECGFGVLSFNRIVMSLLRLDDPLQVFRTCTTQDFARSSKFKNFADGIDVLYLAWRQSAHHCTAVGLTLDKPKSLEARQSFADRVALHAEPVDQRVFDEPLTRMQEAEDYFLFKPAYQRGDGSFCRPSVRLKKGGVSGHICRGHDAFTQKGV